MRGPPKAVSRLLRRLLGLLMLQVLVLALFALNLGEHLVDDMPANLQTKRDVSFGNKRGHIKPATPPYYDDSLLLDAPNETKCFLWEDTVTSDHWWTHHPLWKVSTENDTHSCLSFGRADAYLLEVYRSQFLSDCSRVTTRYLWDSGWAADLRVGVASPLQYATDTGSVLAMTTADSGSWHYAALKPVIRAANGTDIVNTGVREDDHAACPAKDLTCYFLNLTNCPANRANVTTDYFQMGIEYINKQHMMYEYVTRAQQWLRREVYIRVKELADQIPTPCSVMHVRRSDVILHYAHARKYYPISAYYDRLSKYRRDNIFLLTDDANAIDEALEFYPNVNWFYLNRTRFRGSSGGWENQTPSKNPKAEVVTLLATLQLVRRCDSIVYGESGFADLIVNAMIADRPPKFRFKKEKIDRGVEDFASRNNTNSDQKLQALLEQRRRQQHESSVT